MSGHVAESRSGFSAAPGGVVAFLWVRGAGPRLERAQAALEESILALGLRPLRYPAGHRRTPLGEVLRAARAECSGEGFVWCNSDVLLTKNPYDVPNPQTVYGFHRRELPSGRHVQGIDMYYIPVRAWDEILSKDIPRLYIGASYVDWWISRQMERLGVYETLTGYIDHPSHPKSAAAADDRNRYYRKNFLEFNRWAARNGLDPIPAPPHILPFVGHVWGVRDAARKLLAGRRR